MSTAQSITDILVENKVIPEDLAQQTKIESYNTGTPEEEILIKKKLVTEEQLARARANLLHVEFVSLAGKGISPEVLTYIPESVARRYTIFPFSLDASKNELSVAMADPLDIQVIEFIEKKAGKKVKAYLALPDDITQKIDEQYAQNLSKEVTEALKETVGEDVQTFDSTKIGEIIREAPIAKIVSTILEFAMKSRASDVHIEPLEQETRVRYRIDGILNEKLALPRKVHDAVVSRIKILAQMKIDERRIPQDGRFNFKLGSDEVDLRISTLPTVYGEKVVMRLLKKSGGVPRLTELGLRGTALKNLEIQIGRPHGIILVTGPTGSGKTTTLYSVLSKLNTTKVNIVTLEDPVEYKIAGVNQVQINPQAGLTFANGLRSFLRQDPNIILVGEIRDNETTDLAIQAALTGHLVFSTLHTNDASGAIPRLLDMKAEPFLVASSVNGVVGQRISRKICDHCKESFVPPPEVVADIKKVLGSLYTGDSVKLFKGKGCVECGNTGYLGRIGIFEVLVVSEKIAHLILQRAASQEIAREAISEGMITMKQDGYLKAIEGTITIEEVLRVAQD
ncbi:MAG: Flp pilus assembly complex ATPase component TadA [Patescibacteria group bacterium]|nr:Flp pilus assembly complex ATPase component TadA [Patescibacteria group bacterium]